MWILIRQHVPVEGGFRPKFLCVYWAIPWIELTQIQKAFVRFLCDRNEDRKFRQTSIAIEKGIPLEVFERIHDESKYPEDYKAALAEFAKLSYFSSTYASLHSFEDNPAHDMRIIINNEAVKVHGREYSAIKSDRLKELIDGKFYKLRNSSVAEEKLSIEFNPDVRNLYEHAIVDGCTDFEARLTAIGTDIIDQIEIPPIGWYEYIGPDLGIDEMTFGCMSLRPKERKTKNETD